MSEILENARKYGSITLVIVSILMIFVSGFFFAIAYYVMDVTEQNFKLQDCQIQDNAYVSTCQDLWDLSLYPFLALRELLVWMSFFFIFALVLGLLIVGYQSGKSPVLLGLLIVFVLVLTYLGIELSNVYRAIIEQQVMRDMLVNFTVYNKVMLNFPWFVFITGLLSVMLGVVNYQRTKVNVASREELNY